MGGFSLMNMKESDIALMIPGKVGPARKTCTLIDNIKRNKEKCEQKIERYRIIEYKENSAGCRTIDIEHTQSIQPESHANDDPPNQPIGGLNIFAVPMATLPEVSSGGLSIVEVESTSLESSAKVSSFHSVKCFKE